jgi:glucose/arabinose dehydrogenase
LEPFLDLRDRVSVKGATTRGLLGLVFHPQFAENGYFYVHYTGVRGDLVIARYRATADLSSGDPATESILLQVTPPVGEHNGGDLAFGPDGYLYISLGDGGGPGNFDQAGNAQNPETLLGSLLRLDVNGGEPYQIPPDNPYVAGGGRPEIWAYGLRNPWRFTFDPSTGDLYLADVGESSWEEIDFLPAGGSGGVNFGWNYREGAHRFRGEPGASLALVDPVAEYDHTQGCSVTGGRLYRGTMLPEWAGVYLFGDYCQGKIWGLLRKPDGSWQMDLLFQIQAFITSFGVDEQGEVYLVTITGQILKLVRK